ncbi:NFACT RNA binding domain-containing protein [Liquorilactobacillus mali]|uniref:Rqc2 family fibronectin-binding protein n=1 Tax=Liquorilactobacillus mali TaxID=1618 RepID=UPI002653C837|nr:NFACT RNA binding domain-containing protein [Liquorilactobacillus mali]MDN7144736.1 NFACT RNA binding domain-containing protein [Liquorilactobacillus mali]
MPFDGLFTHAMIAELRSKIIGGRVTKISQPFPNEIILTIRSQRQNHPLLLSAHPNYARIQITQIPYNNPPVPTNFTMTLRKYLENAKITEISQLDNDRVAYFSFTTRNELGDELPLLLSIEIMGRYSNVLLINQAENKILDTIKHIGPSQNRFRTLLPGATYIQPPKQDLLNPFTDKSKKYLELVQQFPNREILAKQLQKNYQGIATEHAPYLADRLHDVGDDLSTNWDQALKQADCPTPTIVEGNKAFFTFFKYDNDSKVENAESLSVLLDKFYQKKATSDRVQQQGSQLFHVIKVNLQKNRKKLKKLQQTMDSTQKADILRVKGELLTTYLFQVKRGMTEIELPNYYDSEKPVKIALSNQLSPSQNAQKYFKKYQKLKNAVEYVTNQIKITKAEINYLEEIETQLELADPQDLPDIKVELQQEGYLRAQKQNKSGKVRKNKLGQPDTFYSSEGIKISVGKNNLQNDRLTLKMAQKKDIWLHAKNIHGSHVIIHNSQPGEQTLLEAAELAAYYSKARSSGNVPVDYVEVKNIRKPNGAKPGFVIYEGQQTLYVTPDEDEIKKMKKI